jgi:hypothetical protein
MLSRRERGDADWTWDMMRGGDDISAKWMMEGETKERRWLFGSQQCSRGGADRSQN